MSNAATQELIASTYQPIADRILSGSPGEIALVCLRFDDAVYRVAAYAGDFPVDLISNLDFRAEEGGTGGSVATTGKPRLINDYLVDMADSPFVETGKKVGVRSIVNAACGPAGDVVAVLYVMSRTPNRLTEQDMLTLVAQAKIADVAIRLAQR